MLSKDELITELSLLKDNARRNLQLTRMEIYEEVISMIESAPDVIATWEKRNGKYVCSRCDEVREIDSLFCPSCGARMENCTSWKSSFFDENGNEIHALIEVVK